MSDEINRGSDQAGAIKGVAVRAGLNWFAITHGPAAMQALHNAASPPLRAILNPSLTGCGIVATQWYDVQLIGELLDLFDAPVPAAQLQQYREMLSEAVARDNIHGVYRSLMRLISTRTLLVAHAHRVWSTYCSDGELVATSAREGEIVLTLRSLKSHHNSVCRTVGAVTEKILAHVGYKGASLKRVRCMGRRHPECVFEIDYVC